MIKGVNKKVLEINNPQSLYFEKAVLYLKPNLNSISYKLLRAEAQEMIRSISPRQPRFVFLKKIAIGVGIFMTGFVGALTSFLIIRAIY